MQLNPASSGHTSHVTRHTSHVTRQTSHVTCHISTRVSLGSSSLQPISRPPLHRNTCTRLCDCSSGAVVAVKQLHEQRDRQLSGIRSRGVGAEEAVEGVDEEEGEVGAMLGSLGESCASEYTSHVTSQYISHTSPGTR